MPRSMKELAQEALDVQNASNLLGIANSFYKALCDLRGNGLFSEDIENHPITLMWVWKLTSMVGNVSLNLDNAVAAMAECEKLAKGE